MTVKCRDGHAKSADVTLATFCYGLAFFRWKQMPRSQCEMATNLLPCSSGCIRGYKDQPLFFFVFFCVFAVLADETENVEVPHLLGPLKRCKC